VTASNAYPAILGSTLISFMPESDETVEQMLQNMFVGNPPDN